MKNVKDLRDKVQRAKNNPTELVNLLCKDFNIRQSEQDKWLNFEDINNEETFVEQDVFDTYAVGGVDLSSTVDLTCATILIFRNDKKYVLQQYFIPSANLEYKIKDDKIPYDKWEKRGLITVCEGAKVDYSQVTQWFLRMKDEYQISTLWIGFDPWNSQYWIKEMEDYRIHNVRGPSGSEDNEQSDEAISSRFNRKKGKLCKQSDFKVVFMQHSC